MKRVAPIVVVAALAVAAACAGVSGSRKLRIAVIPKALNNPVFNYAKTGAERAAAELGNVEVIWNGPENADEVRQKEIVESLVEEGVDGIAISVLDPDYLTGAINHAVDEGIPVITWDSDAPNSKRAAFYGVDDYGSGEILGREAARLLGGQGTVAIVTSGAATNLQQRTKGAKAALAHHPGIRLVETCDIKEDPMRCVQLISEGTRRYPDLGAWISVGGWPVFSRHVLSAVDPARTKVVSFDTIPPAPVLLKEGKVQVLLGQKYFGWGAEPVKLLAAMARDNRQPSSTFINSGVDVVTPDNVDTYMLAWARLERGEP
jgi:ribose transport system substrate-binding protein